LAELAHTRHTNSGDKKLFAFVPPRNQLDPVTHEDLLLFLDAVARKTPAFRQLRDKILPLCTSPTQGPVTMIASWVNQWHLGSFKEYETNERIHAWVFEVLDSWKRDPSAAVSLRVDCGWKRGKIGLPRPRWIRMKLPLPELDYESLADYRCKIVTFADQIFADEMERWNLRYHHRRDMGQGSNRDFEWLALAICKQMSAGEIAIVSRIGGSKGTDKVKKALQALYKQGFRPAARTRRKSH
jgi:hypothetical protein